MEYSFPSEEEKVVGDEKIVIPNSVFNPNSEGTVHISVGFACACLRKDIPFIVSSI